MTAQDKLALFERALQCVATGQVRIHIHYQSSGPHAKRWRVAYGNQVHGYQCLEVAMRHAASEQRIAQSHRRVVPDIVIDSPQTGHAIA